MPHERATIRRMCRGIANTMLQAGHYFLTIKFTNMGKEELVRLFDEFLNSNGLWNDWKDFVEQQGHTVKELGFEDD